MKNEPIRVLQVIGEMNCGGAEMLLMNLHRHIDRNVVQFDYVVHTNNEGLYDREIRRPIITTNIPGCREAVIEGESGLLVQPKDVNSLYQAMIKMLEMSNDEREKMGRAGRDYMVKRFNKSKVVSETVSALYNR